MPRIIIPRRKIYVYAEGDSIRHSSVSSGRDPFTPPHGEKPSVRNGSQSQSNFGKYGYRFGIDVAILIDSGCRPVIDIDSKGNKRPLPESVKRSIGVDLAEVILGAEA